MCLVIGVPPETRQPELCSVAFVGAHWCQLLLETKHVAAAGLASVCVLPAACVRT